MPLDLPNTLIVALADFVYEQVVFVDPEYHKEHIEEFVEKAEKYFGEPPISYYPIYPRKKIREFFRGLSPEKLLSFLAWLSEEMPELKGALNKLLGNRGVRLEEGKVLLPSETELKLPEDEKPFFERLDSMGFKEYREHFEQGYGYLRDGKIHEASSKVTLAFDGLFKRMLKTLDGSVDTAKSLGYLINEGVRLGLVEQEAIALLQGFVSLRNLPPQHASSTGATNIVTLSLSYLTAHTARVLASYLMEKFSTFLKTP